MEYCWNIEMDPDEAQRRREECERKARRGEMDPRLEFTFQLLIDATQLPRHQLMDYIFEGDMVAYSLLMQLPYTHFLLCSSMRLISSSCRIWRTSCCGSTRRSMSPSRRQWWMPISRDHHARAWHRAAPKRRRVKVSSFSSLADLPYSFSSLGGASPSGLPPPKHKKLFLTDGWTCAFTGVCIYIFRVNTSKQLPEEGFQKDL